MDVRRRQTRRPAEKESQAGLVARDRLAPSRYVKRPAARPHPRPDAEDLGEAVSWRFSQIASEANHASAWGSCLEANAPRQLESGVKSGANVPGSGRATDPGAPA